MHDEPQPDRLRFFHRLRRNFTMIVVLKHNPNPEQLQSLITWLQEKGIIIHTSIARAISSSAWWAVPRR